MADPNRDHWPVAMGPFGCGGPEPLRDEPQWRNYAWSTLSQTF